MGIPIPLKMFLTTILLLGFVRTRVLMSRLRLNNRATMEADILSVTGILSPEAASVAPCFPFDITISLTWFPLLYLNYTPPGRRGRGIPARPQARLARLFCCRTLRRTELCCDSQKASTQGTVEQSRTQTGSHQTRQMCVASIPDVYGRVHVWEGCCIGIHYTIRKFVVNIWSVRVPYHYCFHYFHSYTNCILTTIHPYGNLNRTTQCLIVS